MAGDAEKKRERTAWVGDCSGVLVTDRQTDTEVH